MRPSFFVIPTLFVLALAVACQPAPEVPPEQPQAVPAQAGAEGTAERAPTTGDTAAVFRATGNEPGWSVDVAAGNAPAMRVELDYGQTRYAVDRATHGADGWAGAAADGTPVKLSVQRVPCQDDMSGARFDAKVMLTVGTRQLHGCGQFLQAP